MAQSTELKEALAKHPAHTTNLALQLVSAQMKLAGIAFEHYQNGFIARLNLEGRNTMNAMYKSNPHSATHTLYQHNQWQDGYIACDKVLNGPTQ